MQLSILSLLALLPILTHSATVNIDVAPGGQLKFSPASVTISVGDSVQFNFRSSPHTVTHGANCQRGGAFELSSSGSQPFNKAGSFPFFCSMPGHCRSGMQGVVIVKDSGSGNSNAPSPAPSAGGDGSSGSGSTTPAADGSSGSGGTLAANGTANSSTPNNSTNGTNGTATPNTTSSVNTSTVPVPPKSGATRMGGGIGLSITALVSGLAIMLT